jgi:hypothetical protein
MACAPSSEDIDGGAIPAAPGRCDRAPHPRRRLPRLHAPVLSEQWDNASQVGQTLIALVRRNPRVDKANRCSHGSPHCHIWQTAWPRLVYATPISAIRVNSATTRKQGSRVTMLEVVVASKAAVAMETNLSPKCAVIRGLQMITTCSQTVKSRRFFHPDCH